MLILSTVHPNQEFDAPDRKNQSKKVAGGQ
jgi:hypothetical protein